MITRTSTSNQLNSFSILPKLRFIGAGLAALSIGLGATFAGCGDKDVRLPTHKVAGRIVASVIANVSFQLSCANAPVNGFKKSEVFRWAFRNKCEAD